MKALIIAITFILCSFPCHAHLDSVAPDSPLEQAMHKIRFPSHSITKSFEDRVTEACVEYGITKSDLFNGYVDNIRAPILTNKNLNEVDDDLLIESESALKYAMQLSPGDPIVENAAREVMEKLVISGSKHAPYYLMKIKKYGSIELINEIKNIYSVSATKSQNVYNKEVKSIESAKGKFHRTKHSFSDSPANLELRRINIVDAVCVASAIGIVAIILIYFVRRRRIKSKYLISVCIIITALISVGFFLQKHTGKLSQAKTVPAIIQTFAEWTATRSQPRPYLSRFLSSNDWSK